MDRSCLEHEIFNDGGKSHNYVFRVCWAVEMAKPKSVNLNMNHVFWEYDIVYKSCVKMADLITA